MTVTGGGSNNPTGVKFPGAYKATDPGILINIHSAITSYTIPGPAVIAGGTSKTPNTGAVCAKAKMMRGADIFASK